MIDLKKNHPRMIPVILLVFVLCLMAVQPAFALFGEKVDSFAADMVEIAPGGKVVNTSKIYMTPDAMRIDGMPGGGQGMPKMNISILVLKKQDKQYFYNHDKKLVFESPVDEEMSKAGYKAMDNIESEKVLGKEKVSGYKCVKKEVVTSMAAMGQTIKTRLIVWESDEFEFPLRTQDEDGFIQEMRNIDTGKPSQKLFGPLTGYKKVDNMMAVMGMDFKSMMARDEDEDNEEESAASRGDDVDTKALLAHLEQTMGKNMSPEQKAQMMAVMAQTMGQVDQTNVGEGASKDLWKIIPQKPGDKVGYEMKIQNTLDVILGTNSTLQQVFDFYGKKLSAKGWKDGGTYVQNGQGTMTMTKEGQMILFAWADRPRDIKGNFKLYYNVHYTGEY